MLNLGFVLAVDNTTLGNWSSVCTGFNHAEWRAESEITLWPVNQSQSHR